MTSALDRRRAEPTLTLPLVGVALALLLIVGGVMAIGRGLFTSSAF
ncbi:MAG: hypothetical protein KF850_04335 [Labilithrix sp.]|nr:hypothetical protein [Labilithrix sp.]MBX3211238.1 hypothetical protein [Labilithrix sp.]